MDWMDIVLWLLAGINVLLAGYYDVFKDDDVKTTKHNVTAITLIVIYIGGQL